jgi:hypothetical protein
MVNNFLWFFCLGQPMPPAGLDLNFSPDPLGGDMSAHQEDNVQGDWDQWIENIQPDQQIPQPIQPDEQQLRNQHSGLSSDSSIGPIQDAPLQNGHILEDGPVMPGDGPAFNVAPFNGPQEVDGLVIQMDPLPVNAGQPPQAQDGG